MFKWRSRSPFREHQHCGKKQNQDSHPGNPIKAVTNVGSRPFQAGFAKLHGEVKVARLA